MRADEDTAGDRALSSAVFLWSGRGSRLKSTMATNWFHQSARYHASHKKIKETVDRSGGDFYYIVDIDNRYQLTSGDYRWRHYI